jgi:hypothetical protein
MCVVDGATQRGHSDFEASRVEAIDGKERIKGFASGLWIHFSRRKRVLESYNL